MNIFRKYFIIIFVFTAFLLSEKANAGEFSRAVDSTINFTAKTVYFVTKYTLKTGVFVTKKAVKGTYLVTKSVFKGTTDAVKPPAKTQQKPQTNIINPNNAKPLPQVYTLPPPPKY